jgi:voltage-gated potassium channel
MKHKPHYTKNVAKIVYIKEIVVLILVLLSLVFLGVEEFGHLTKEQIKWLDWYEVILGIVFMTEFFWELYRAKHKIDYVWHHWYYLLASIPLPNAYAEVLRGLRLIRFIKLLRFGVHMEHEKEKKLF